MAKELGVGTLGARAEDVDALRARAHASELDPLSLDDDRVLLVAARESAVVWRGADDDVDDLPRGRVREPHRLLDVCEADRLLRREEHAREGGRRSEQRVLARRALRLLRLVRVVRPARARHVVDVRRDPRARPRHRLRVREEVREGHLHRAAQRQVGARGDAGEPRVDGPRRQRDARLGVAQFPRAHVLDDAAAEQRRPQLEALVPLARRDALCDAGQVLQKHKRRRQHARVGAHEHAPRVHDDAHVTPLLGPAPPSHPYGVGQLGRTVGQRDGVPVDKDDRRARACIQDLAPALALV